MSQLFTSGGQSIGVSASPSVLPVNIQGLFSSGWTGWISLQSKGLSRVFSNTTVQNHQFFFMVQLSHPYMTTGKTVALTLWTWVMFKHTYWGKACKIQSAVILEDCHLQEGCYPWGGPASTTISTQPSQSDCRATEHIYLQSASPRASVP